MKDEQLSTYDMMLRCFNPKYQPKKKESKYEQD